MKSRRKRILVVLACGLLIGIIVWKFVVAPYVVVGDSMLPTLRTWDLCWMARTRHYEPRRGDVVLFRTADNPPLYFIKRVVALPGETLAIERGVVTINQVPLPEPYTTANPEWTLPATNLPPAKIYVIGDNRDVPLDLTVHGPVATRLVSGRMITYWRWRK